jgi:hypothetical protein
MSAGTIANVIPISRQQALSCATYKAAGLFIDGRKYLFVNRVLLHTETKLDGANAQPCRKIDRA